MTLLQDQLDRIEDDVSLIKKLLTGNDDPGSGLIVRVDRIEQRAKVAAWLARSTLAGLLGSMGVAIWALFTGNHTS